MTFKEKHKKKVRELKKLNIRIGNTGDEVTEIRREVSFRKDFYPNSAIRPQHLNEDANLVEIKSWIPRRDNTLRCDQFETNLVQLL